MHEASGVGSERAGVVLEAAALADAGFAGRTGAEQRILDGDALTAHASHSPSSDRQVQQNNES